MIMTHHPLPDMMPFKFGHWEENWERLGLGMSDDKSAAASNKATPVQHLWKQSKNIIPWPGNYAPQARSP